ncbi:dephospho-CoA kinase [Azonexus sp.]|uniref:dephospho-CoA kinase n=1 Tax=Azonexus sp. TaxID=1872668 RepID=UPI002821524E|nr:dephospho-CoA kinase [Azonexus sp.]MDR1995292.1 dephospho-CoA kinase [Azonexus sp.]
MSAYVVGLTGGIGSGKSRVGELFVERGAALVDTDAIAHQLTGPGGAALPALLAEFGPQVVDARGALDRAAMRRQVFADPTRRRRLEAILHPLIGQEADRRCRAAAAPYVILAVPLLVESGGYRDRCQRILVVDCPEELQIARVMARNGHDELAVRGIMAAQATRAERLAVADDVIANDGDFAALAAQVDALHLRYLRLLAEIPKANC